MKERRNSCEMSCEICKLFLFHNKNIAIITPKGVIIMYSIKIDKPYPEVEPMYCPRNARCIINDYSSSGDSEMSAINTYMYQSFVLADKYPELSKLLVGIALTEMHHLELLAEAIIASGCDPVFSGSNGYWNAMCVNYCKNPIEIIKFDIMSEKKAIANYKKAMCCVNNESICKLIARIILDEQLHIEELEKALEQFACSGDYCCSKCKNKYDCDDDSDLSEESKDILQHLSRSISVISKIVTKLEGNYAQSQQDIQSLRQQMNSPQSTNDNYNHRLHQYD